MSASLLRLRSGAAVRLQVFTLQPDPQTLAATACEVKDWFKGGAVATHALTRASAKNESYVLVASPRGAPVWIPATALVTADGLLEPTASRTADELEGVVSVAHAVPALGSCVRTDFVPVEVTTDVQWVQIGNDAEQVLLRRWNATRGEGFGPVLYAPAIDVLEKSPGPRTLASGTPLGSVTESNFRQLELQPDDDSVVFELLARFMRWEDAEQKVDVAEISPLALDSLALMGARPTEINERDTSRDSEDSSWERDRTFSAADVEQLTPALNEQTVAVPTAATDGKPARAVPAPRSVFRPATADTVPMGVAQSATAAPVLSGVVNSATVRPASIEGVPETAGTVSSDAKPTTIHLDLRPRDQALGERSLPAGDIALHSASSPHHGGTARFDDFSRRLVPKAHLKNPLEVPTGRLEIEPPRRMAIPRADGSAPLQTSSIGSHEVPALTRRSLSDGIAQLEQSSRIAEVGTEAIASQGRAVEQSPTATTRLVNATADVRCPTAPERAARFADGGRGGQSPPLLLARALNARVDNRNGAQRAEPPRTVALPAGRLGATPAREAPIESRSIGAMGDQSASGSRVAFPDQLATTVVRATRAEFPPQRWTSHAAGITAPPLAVAGESRNRALIPAESDSPLPISGRSRVPRGDDDGSPCGEPAFISRLQLASATSPTVGAQDRAKPVVGLGVTRPVLRHFGTQSELAGAPHSEAILHVSQKPKSVSIDARMERSSVQNGVRRPLAQPVDSPVAAIASASLGHFHGRSQSPSESAAVALLPTPPGAATLSLRHCVVARAVEIGDIVVELGSPEVSPSAPAPRTGSLIAAIPLSRMTGGRR